MKKIAIVTDSIMSGGIARVSLTLKSIFEGNGHQCTIYSVYDHGESIVSEGVDLNSKRHGYFNRLHEISKKIGNNYTHVFVLTMGKLSVVFSFFNLGYKRKTYVCEHISFDSYPLWLKCLKKMTYWLYKGVVLLTNYDHKLLERQCKKTYWIQNPSPFKASTNHRNNNSKRYLVVGHLIPRKGCFRMLDNWILYKKHGGKGTLSFAGNGELLPALLKYSKEYKIPDVFFLGTIKDIISVYEQHDVLLCTSISEGLPMTFIEAQSFGIPVISYDIKTGPAEIIVDGKNGYLITNDDSETFVFRMFDVEQTEVYEKMSKISLAEMNKYSRETIYEQWEKLLNEE